MYGTTTTTESSSYGFVDEMQPPVDLDVLFDSSSKNFYNICDRRLSRAARKLLRKHILRAQHRQDGNSILLENDKETSQIDVWSLLDDLAGRADASKCPLIPSRDIWRHDEEHTTKIRPSSFLNFAYPTHAIQQRRKAKNQKLKNGGVNHWFQCGYCGKTFATQYYFDIHVHTQHNPLQHHRILQPYDAMEHVEESRRQFLLKEHVVCPADDWCRIVGVANCHEQALIDEPYYGRGSGGWGEDRKYVEHKWRKEAHSIGCDVEAIRKECITILGGACAFGHAIADEICNGLECPTHHIWQSFSDSISVYLPDDYHDTWIEEARHHKGFTVLVLVVILAFVIYFSETDFDFMKPPSKKKEKQHHRGNRLLRKGPGSNVGGSTTKRFSRLQRRLSSKDYSKYD